MMNRPQLRRVCASFALTAVLSLIPPTSAHAAGLARWGRDEPGVSSWMEARGSWFQRLLVHLLQKAGVQIDPEGNK